MNPHPASDIILRKRRIERDEFQGIADVTDIREKATAPASISQQAIG